MLISYAESSPLQVFVDHVTSYRSRVDIQCRLKPSRKSESQSDVQGGLGTERLTGALLDRLTHHVNILEMNGESYRLYQSRARLAKSGK